MYPLKNYYNENSTLEKRNTEHLIDNIRSFHINDPKIELNFRNGGVLGPHSLLKYYEPVFENYITNNICFKASKYSTTGDTFFYCKKEFNNEIKKIKENFPTISFQSNDLNKTFILEAADLFLEQGDYVYCLLYFQFYGNDWKLGRPFLKKYQFSFNFDKKYIKTKPLFPSQKPLSLT